MSDDQGKSKLGCIIRVINFASGGLMIGFGIAGMVYMIVNSIIGARFFLLFSPIFMIIFGLMIIAAQCQIEMVTSRVGFLQSLIGRAIFNIYLSSTVFYFFSCGKDNLEWLGWTLASIMFAVGVVYIVLYFCGGRQLAQQSQKKDVKEQMM